MAAVYAKNGATVFKAEVSENKITAVCADETADYFYAGDDQGNLYVLDKKGDILQRGSMPAEVSGAVLAIYAKVDIDLAFSAYTSKGYTRFLDVTTEMKEEITSTDSSNFSFDGDGTFHTNRGDGQHGVLRYNNKSEARLMK